MLIRIILISLALSPFPILAQANLLQSGPMLGYAEMREAVVWIQTTTPAQVYAVYMDTATGDHWSTDTIFTSSHNASCGKLYFTEVQPGTTYSYRLYVNNQEVKRAYPFRFTTQKDWMYKSDPPAFRMAMGSCSYINEQPYDRAGKPYGSHYE
ncbi:MAG: phosphodiesterase, partial [Owenweeksia sp.]|nr:phosphodiesterase [Owenweeksia sp.]